MYFENYLIQQINSHPSVQPQDIVKMCYQAAYGAEHLLSDTAAARNYFEKEWAATAPADMVLYENISENVCRINLAAWKFRALPPEWLFQMFVASASVVPQDCNQLFLHYLETVEAVLAQYETSFTSGDWQAYLTHYKKIGMPSVHHSPQYRACESPAYRIINRQYTRLFPILEIATKHMKDNKPCVISIDGRAASGKSTMAGDLKMILGADIIHMDDFFLPTGLRTKERFSTPGGNVHYERFIAEVLPNISLPQSFAYRIFDCGKLDYDGECVIKNPNFRIVEGSYSCHPAFGDYADITVFSTVSADEQMRRIYARNGLKMAERFRNEWIPLEENYFAAYQIAKKATITVLICPLSSRQVKYLK